MVAPKKHATNIITTSSWRAGQDIQRKYKKEISMKKSGKSQRLKPDEVSTTRPSELITSPIQTERGIYYFSLKKIFLL